MTPLMDHPELTQFHANDAVQLLDRLGDLPSGATGRIVGWFARSEPTFVLSFEGLEMFVEVLVALIDRVDAGSAA